MTPEEIAELRAAAEAATQIAYDAPNPDEWKTYESYIALANPQTVLALLDALAEAKEALRKGECEWCRQSVANMDDALRQFYEERTKNEDLVADAVYWKRKSDDMLHTYEAKVQDFAVETLRNSDFRTQLAERDAENARLRAAMKFALIQTEWWPGEHTDCFHVSCHLRQALAGEAKNDA